MLAPRGHSRRIFATPCRPRLPGHKVVTRWSQGGHTHTSTRRVSDEPLGVPSGAYSGARLISPLESGKTRMARPGCFGGAHPLPVPSQCPASALPVPWERQTLGRAATPANTPRERYRQEDLTLVQEALRAPARPRPGPA